jgi:hypothetical protein
MGRWFKSFFWAGGFGVIMILFRALLMIFGLSEVATLWTTSIVTILGAVAIVWNQIYQVGHADDQEEKLETALYAALKERQAVAGSDVSSKIAAASQVEGDSHTSASR